MKNIAQRLAHGGRELGLALVAEASGRGDARGRDARVLQDLQRIGDIGGQLIHTFLFRRIGVLHGGRADLLNGSAGLEVDHARVGDHLGRDVPIGAIDFADELEALLQFFPWPAGQFAVEPADACGIGDETEFSLHALIGAEFPELAHERIGDLGRPVFPGLQVARTLRPGGAELGHAKLPHVHQAGRVINDKAKGHAGARIKNLDGLILRWAIAGRDFRRAGDVGSGEVFHHARTARSSKDGRAEKVATTEWAHVSSAVDGIRVHSGAWRQCNFDF